MLLGIIVVSVFMMLLSVLLVVKAGPVVFKDKRTDEQKHFDHFDRFGP